MAIRAGFTAFFTATAMSAVGDAFPSGTLGNIAGHALVGCMSAVMGGGKCGPGALAAGVGAAATPLIQQAFPNPRTDAGDLFGGTAASAVLGGLGSVAGGGAFANGAVTAAFGYLFNAVLHAEVGVRVPGWLAKYLPGCKTPICYGVEYSMGVAISYPSIYDGDTRAEWDAGFTKAWTYEFNVDGSPATPGPLSAMLKQIPFLSFGKTAFGFNEFSGPSDVGMGTIGIMGVGGVFRVDPTNPTVNGKLYGDVAKFGSWSLGGSIGRSTTCVITSGARYGC
jgi:hypothetical protein